MAEGDAAAETVDKKMTKDEYLAQSKADFDLALRVRMHGVFRCEDAVNKRFGQAPGSFGVDRLKQIENACNKADTSHGVSYMEKGLLYGFAMRQTELGFRAGYVFLCNLAKEMREDKLVG